MSIDQGAQDDYGSNQVSTTNKVASRNIPNARLQSIEPIGTERDSQHPKIKSPNKIEQQKRLTNRNGQFLMQQTARKRNFSMAQNYTQIKTNIAANATKYN